MIDVAADIGGTFTDCIVRWSDERTARRQRLKVLSSGLVQARVQQRWIGGIMHLAVPTALTHDGFWVGADFVVQSDHGSERRLPIETWQHVGSSESITHVAARLPESGFTIDAGCRCILDGHLEAPVLAMRLLLGLPIGAPLPPTRVRLGTTRGTNALLTRDGAAIALLTTTGFADLLSIGTQVRPELFDLTIRKPPALPRAVLEIDGRLDRNGIELEPLNTDRVRQDLKRLRRSSPELHCLAICLLHSARSDVHERRVHELAVEAGFDRVVCSSEVAAVPGMLARASTACLDAYLQPVLDDYVARVRQQLGGENRCHLRWMTSSGNLVSSNRFRGRDSVLSGPAGGVVALATIAKRLGVPVVGLDMGGTSTDVSYCDGQIGHRHESVVAGIPILTPMMDIHTIAAGGGSVCDIRDGRLAVGPDSAGAEPGPACYGRGGPLTITDVNLLLGRLLPDRFPFPLDLKAAEAALRAAHARLPSTVEMTEPELAEGFLSIAVTGMAEAVRVVTTAAGHDAREMTLVGFGGAAGGHVCRVADALGMNRIMDHADAGLFSAVGIESAEIGRIRSVSVEWALADGAAGPRVCHGDTMDAMSRLADRLRRDVTEQLREEELLGSEQDLTLREEVDLRYRGTQSSLTVVYGPPASLADRFDAMHRQAFGYSRPEMPIEAVAMRVEAKTLSHRDASTPHRECASKTLPHSCGDDDMMRIDRDELSPGTRVDGPCMISSAHSVLIVERNWYAVMGRGYDIQLHRNPRSQVDAAGHHEAIEMEIATRTIQGIAESMGEVIRRTSVSVNVKERRDYSCAVFLGDGSLIANAPHVPVHLGAMGHCVRSLMKTYQTMSDGDAYLSNDPFAGGSHLPDVTVVTPVFCDDPHERPDGWPCDFFVASRCHHAEIGGMVPGSMAPNATCLAEEGIVMRNMPLVRNGQSHHDALRRHLRAGPYPSRNALENMADVSAAEAAGREGARRLMQVAKSMSTTCLHKRMLRLMDVAGHATEQWIESLGDEPRTFRDRLDDGSIVQVTMRRDSEKKKLQIDFSGTADVHPYAFNATKSIVTSAVLYVLRCVSNHELPLCDGVLRPIELRIPSGLLDPPGGDDPSMCPAVVAGNVETSNRVVDVLLGCLGVAAASQGTMNNWLIGDDTFGYYETVGGGAGATPDGDGGDAVHTHMTNTRITDPEILESRLPVRLVRFAIRRGSGGRGAHRGGDGVIREVEFLQPLTLSLITSRRTTAPYGMAGGEPGAPGQQSLLCDGRSESLPPVVTRSVVPGDRLLLETPGGGAWGSPRSTIHVGNSTHPRDER
ncbi:MAG: hydantoinase B/oxoprolinase family protein [Planctomycetota bacterium]